MPTGYTSTLMEEGQTFQEFVLTCARAFGACITLRDEPVNTPIPEEFSPSNYHTEAIDDAKNTLDKLITMTEEEKLSFGTARKEKELKRSKAYLVKNQEQNKRLQEMKQKVLFWNPPTNDYKELKTFMLQQIDISRNDEKYYFSSLEEIMKNSPMEYYTSAFNTAIEDIKYHTKKNEEEINKVKTKNRWIKQLRESIKE